MSWRESGKKGLIILVVACIVCLVSIHTNRYELSGPSVRKVIHQAQSYLWKAGNVIHSSQSYWELVNVTEELPTRDDNLSPGHYRSDPADVYNDQINTEKDTNTNLNNTTEKDTNTNLNNTTGKDTNTNINNTKEKDTNTNLNNTTEKTANEHNETNSKKKKKQAKQNKKAQGKEKKKKMRYRDYQYQRDHFNELNWTQAMSDKVQKELNKRAEGVEAGCSSLEVQRAPKPNVMYVERHLVHVKEKKFMWCPVHKAASTTWAKNLLRLVGDTNTINNYQGNARKHFPPPQTSRDMHHVPKDTTWLLIVRHPLQRLLSAYRDKMLRERKSRDRFVQMQKQIVTAYQDPNQTTTTTTTTNNTLNANTSHVPTFTQFLLKVKDDVESVWTGRKRPINQHWSPYWLLCAPCQLHYHLIAHVETFTRDQEYLIHRFHMEDQAVNIHSHASNFDSYEGTDEATQHYFSQVPKELLNQIIQLYLPDFILFDYSPDEYLKLLPSVQSSTNEH
ncbi:hypothetical protein Pmani_020363 [Petrolisthes manimaculis]|uniref:Carbohydrate sulfotransferase n=1 Tax=Petrolisthes manimaculis TaxID=1843537 RepID=A0AAE1PIJ7_9EUCA|nr:hypothetical protein Pmani_020363 [Petrolisthes manimaculis]